MNGLNVQSMIQMFSNHYQLNNSDPAQFSKMNESFLAHLNYYTDNNIIQKSLQSDMIHDEKIEQLTFKLTKLLDDLIELVQDEAFQFNNFEQLNELLNDILNVLNHLDTYNDKLDFNLLINIYEQINELNDTDNELIGLIQMKLESLLNGSIEDQNNHLFQANFINEQSTHLNYRLQAEKLEQITMNIKQLLTELNEGNIRQIASQLLPLLRQLLSFTNENDEILTFVYDKLPKDQANGLSKLLTSFKNRMNLAQTGYKFEAEVTAENIAKWLKDALTNQNVNLTNHITTERVNLTSHVPVSNVEQYVIHVNEALRVERIEEQLVRQLKTVMNQSRFLQTPQMTQLSLTLTPRHLGNIQVQLMEVNGELAVKMIASSVAAKKLLESNIHQLKHLFAPHNVVIEREGERIGDIEQLDEQMEENDEQMMSDEEKSRDEEQLQDETHSFNESFEEFLTNILVDGKE